MEAVIATGGKQYRVAPGQVISVEKLAGDKGAAVEFTSVLLVNRTARSSSGPKALKSAKVSGEVVVAEAASARSSSSSSSGARTTGVTAGTGRSVTTVRITKIEV